MAPASSQQQQPHAVQAIIDSLTRCFNPIDGESPFSGGCPQQPPSDSPKTTTRKNPNRRGSISSNAPARAHSSSGDLKSQYDADRYLYRKLEIFRTNSEDLAEMGIERRPTSKRHDAQSRRQHNTLIDSSDDDIANLTKAHKRAMEEAAASKRKDNPVASLVRLLQDPFSCISEAQEPFGLCFATPIRTASAENIDNMSDWKLTAEEFEARQRKQAEMRAKKCNKFPDVFTCDIPDMNASSASHSHVEDEEETITSASYFDQKYSHIVEENPPMPLFLEHRIAVSEAETDEIFNLVERRQEADKGSSLPPNMPESPSSKRRNTPAENVIVKKHSSENTTPRMKTKKSSSSSRNNSSSKSSKRPSSNTMKNRRYDTVPVAKSSSVSSQSGEDLSHGNDRHHMTARLREPDVVHAEI